MKAQILDADVNHFKRKSISPLIRTVSAPNVLHRIHMMTLKPTNVAQGTAPVLSVIIDAM